MNAQKPPSCTSAPAPPPPRPPRNARPSGAPFTAFAREPVGVAAPSGELSRAVVEDTKDKQTNLLDMQTATESPTGALSRALQPPLESTPDAKALPPALSDAPEPHARPRAHDDPLDPMLRQPGLFAPPVATTPMTAPAPEATVAARASTSLEELLPQLVRKIAWSGDGKRGAVRMELGAGVLAGATLMLESEGGRVRVHLNAPPGVDGEAWKRRIGARLAAKRIEVESIEVK